MLIDNAWTLKNLYSLAALLGRVLLRRDVRLSLGALLKRVVKSSLANIPRIVRHSLATLLRRVAIHALAALLGGLIMHPLPTLLVIVMVHSLAALLGGVAIHALTALLGRLVMHHLPTLLGIVVPHVLLTVLRSIVMRALPTMLLMPTIPGSIVMRAPTREMQCRRRMLLNSRRKLWHSPLMLLDSHVRVKQSRLQLPGARHALLTLLRRPGAWVQARARAGGMGG